MKRTVSRVLLTLVLSLVAAGLLPALPPAPDGPPVVGLVLNREQAEAVAAGKPAAVNYRKAIENSGASVLLLSPLTDAPALLTAAGDLDGLLVPGGDDISPACYGAAPDARLEATDPELDRLEVALLKFARVRGLPVLGICRGAQLINVVHGGTLCQDLPTRFQGKKAVEHRRMKGEEYLPCPHKVAFRPGSRIAEITGAGETETNSFHHQGVEKPGSDLTVTGETEDGLPEVLEGNGPAVLLGVQFHPEKATEDPGMRKIFAAFLNAAEHHRQERIRQAVEKPKGRGAQPAAE